MRWVEQDQGAEKFDAEEALERMLGRELIWAHPDGQVYLTERGAWFLAALRRDDHMAAVRLWQGRRAA